MITRFVHPSSITLDPGSLKSFLRLRRDWPGASEFETSARNLHSEILALLHPAYQYDLIGIRAADPTAARTQLSDGTEFSGAGLARMLRGCSSAALFLLTVGAPPKVFRSVEGDLVAEYLLDGVLSALAVGLLTCVEAELETESAGRACRLTHRYAPGYPHWPLEDQAPLFSRLQPAAIGLQLTDEFVMIPRHSLSGIYGLRSF